MKILAFEDLAVEAIVSFTSVFLAFALALWWDRRKEAGARKESLTQIKQSLKAELEVNLDLVTSERFKIWRESLWILTRPLRTATWELVAGREDLKFLDPTVLMKLAEAYNQIRDFNNILNSMWTLGLIEGKKVIYPVAGSVDVGGLIAKQLAEERDKTVDKIKEALKTLGE